jgi:integrase
MELSRGSRIERRFPGSSSTARDTTLGSLRHDALHPASTSNRRCILSKLRATGAHRAQILSGGRHKGESPHLWRNVERPPQASPVDAHERARDYLSEEAFALLLLGTSHSRYRWRNTAMLMLTFYHGVRVTELCRLKRQDVDLPHGRIWIQRLKGRLSAFR